MERVVIIGGGLSGLCLAHALLQQGWDVQVYERDVNAELRGQGYRLTIKPPAFETLKKSLPPSLYQFICETTKRGIPGRSGFAFLDSQLDPFYEMVFGEPTPAGESLPPHEAPMFSGQVDRKTLRQALLVGLEERVHWGQSFASYRETADRVTVTFQNGAVTEASLLVAADGVHSAVRRQKFPQLKGPVECPVHTIFGKTLLDQLPPSGKLQQRLERFGFFSLGPHGHNMFAVSMKFATAPHLVAHRLGLTVGRCPREDYIMWAISVPTLADPIMQDPLTLHQQALAHAAHFHPDLQALVRQAEVADTLVVPIRYMPAVPAWTPGRVTLIGDAIHTMPPFGANGANTALKDVQVLADQLQRHLGSERRPLSECVGEYEAEMRVYSQHMVKDGLRMMRATCSPDKKVRCLVFSILWLLRIFTHPLMQRIRLPLLCTVLILVLSWLYMLLI